MSFYSYKNAHTNCCPGAVNASTALDGIQEKVCIQVKRVYDSCLQQKQLTNVDVTITSYAQVVNNGCSCACNNGNVETNPPTSAPVPPITFESCRSSTTDVDVNHLNVERLCDRPCFARVRGRVHIPIDILFTDSRCVEYIGKGVITVNEDVLLSVPDESIVPFRLEAMASAVCVSGTYIGDNVFRMTVCVTVILKVIAKVEMMVPSYGFCTIPPCEEFAENVCDEFFSLPLFPPALCEDQNVQGNCGCGQGCNQGCNSGNCGCRRNAF
ncbi:MAG: hypothetical protein IKT57_09010 [Clostridia bacterium]|nr:hypothetical protein [Clostridia bacterium]